MDTKEKDEPVMYIVINHDLKMGKGKIAAQAAHSACKVIEKFERCIFGSCKGGDWSILHYYQWKVGSYTKIVLRATEEQMKQLIEKYPGICVFTYDEGRTQIKSGSLTSIAFFPINKQGVPKELIKLKLL
jgi:peptidyl-tRNA hydrolase, PTH2 family